MNFILFGFKSARRNYQRSTLAIVSIALVTLTLIGALSLGRGKPGLASLGPRQFIGGDIIIFAEAIATQEVNAYPDPLWRLYRRSPDQAGLLGTLMPRAVNEGIMVDVNHTIPDLNAVIEQVRSVEGVEAVYPIYELPVLLELSGGETVGSTLRARFLELDRALGFDERVVTGRYLSDDGGLEALAENWVPDINPDLYAIFGYSRFNDKRIYYQLDQPVISVNWAPSPGEGVTAHVPVMLSAGEAGLPVFDYTNLTSHQLDIVGNFQLPIRRLIWSSQYLTQAGIVPGPLRRNEDYPQYFTGEDTYWTTSQLQVSWKTFQDIANEAGAAEVEPTALAVIVHSISNVQDTVESLRRELAAGTIISVPDWFETQDVVVEPLLKVPPADYGRLHSGYGLSAPSSQGSFTIPSIVSFLLVVLAYIIGGGLYAANISILLAQRRKELAIMKVLGASNAQVLAAVMTELVVLGLTGALVGLLLMSPLVLWHFGTSQTLAELVSTTASLSWQVLALGALLCLAFGGVPAYLSVRRTVGQVIYDED